MSNHRQATPVLPGLAPIAFNALMLAAVTAATYYVTAGEVTDGRHAVGGVLGVVLAVSLVFQTMTRILDRMAAVEAHRRRQERARRRYGAGAAPVDPEPGTDAQRSAEDDGWPQPIEQPGPWPDRGEDTQVIIAAPSPAALSAIGVPVFRSEAERAAWLHRQDTEIFTRPPEWSS